MKSTKIELIQISGMNTDPIEFWVGISSQDNFRIIDNSHENDLWFHVIGRPSCHVIAKTGHLKLSKTELLKIAKQGAILCKKNSKYKSINNLEIVYTFVKNITKTETIGSVMITSEKKLKI